MAESACSRRKQKRLYERFLTWFGDLKYFHYPLFMVWDPGSYKVKGEDMRELIGLLEPGDILLRGYDSYVDGLFIPGTFSHVGFFYGEVTPEQRDEAAAALDPACAEEVRRETFRPGEQMVIHSIAEGVLMEDVLTFARCDRLVVLRLPDTLRRADDDAQALFDPALFTPGERQLRERLEAGESISRAEVVEQALAVALSNLGQPYDFAFDFESHRTFSCSEFAYYCYRAINRYIALTPVDKRLLWVSRPVIEPDRFLHTEMELVWASRSARDLEALAATPRRTG